MGLGEMEDIRGGEGDVERRGGDGSRGGWEGTRGDGMEGDGNASPSFEKFFLSRHF